MSCPSCQVAGRRLPSLPLAYITKSQNRMLCKGVDPTGNEMVCKDSMVQPSSRLKTPNNEINIQEEVMKYLETHPEKIEEYIEKKATREQLERWLIRKAKSQKRTRDSSAQLGKLRTFSNWKFCVHKDKRKLLEKLTSEINKNKNRSYIINELAESISHAIKANRFNLYLMDQTRMNLMCYSDSSPETWAQQSLATSKTIAAHVGRENNLVYVTEILGDDRFPEGTGKDGLDKSVICYPLSSSHGELYGVVEFIREVTSPTFCEEDLEIACSYLTWGSIAVHYADISIKLEMHSGVLDFVNKCVRSIPSISTNCHELLKSVTVFCKERTKSDHFILYLLNDERSELTSELTDFFILKPSTNENTGKQRSFKQAITEGIPGYVTKTKKLWNVRDAYTDPYFSRVIDKDLGYTTKTILAAPILLNDRCLGVLQFFNKSQGVYNKQDEEMVNLCTSFYSLAIHYVQRNESQRRSENEIAVLKELYCHHTKPRRKELKDVYNSAVLVEIPDDFYKFSFDFYQSANQASKLSFILAKDILEKCQVPYCEKVLVRFLATAKKHYREMPYHNWCHAFSVAHFAYMILQGSYQNFSRAEVLALFFGSLCHDLDHRGRNNAFYILTDHPISRLYETSTLENHHYYITSQIFAQQECDVFSSMDKDERQEVMNAINHVIIATDLMEYFKNRNILGPIVESGTYDWSNKEHRKLACALIMTNSDLCGSCKPYEISKISAIKVFEEFYSQGDEELKLGFTPIPMFTRKDEMALNQAGFLNAVVMPCVKILKKIIPTLNEVEEDLKTLLDQWEDYAKEEVEQEISAEDIQQLRIPGSKVQENSLSFVRYNKSNLS